MRTHLKPLLWIGGGLLAVAYVIEKVTKATGAALAQAIDPSTVIPAGSSYVANNGQTGTLMSNTSVANLQTNGIDQVTTPNGTTIDIPPAPIPAGHA